MNTYPSIHVLKALAEEAELAKRSFTWDRELHVEETAPGLVRITESWIDWTGMGSEYESRKVFYGSAEDAFVILCRWANQETE